MILSSYPPCNRKLLFFRGPVILHHEYASHINTLVNSFLLQMFPLIVTLQHLKKHTNSNNTCFLVKRTEHFYLKVFFSSIQTEMIVLVRSDIAQLQQVSLSYSLSLSLQLHTCRCQERLAGLSELLCTMSGVIHLVARIINFLLEGLTQRKSKQTREELMCHQAFHINQIETFSYLLLSSMSMFSFYCKNTDRTDKQTEKDKKIKMSFLWKNHVYIVIM